MPEFFVKRSAPQALSLAAFLTFGATSALALPALPRTVPLAAERLYVPGGFDSNDDVEFILHGNLPSTVTNSVELNSRSTKRTRRSP